MRRMITLTLGLALLAVGTIEIARAATNDLELIPATLKLLEKIERSLKDLERSLQTTNSPQAMMKLAPEARELREMVRKLGPAMNEVDFFSWREVKDLDRKIRGAVFDIETGQDHAEVVTALTESRTLVLSFIDRVMCKTPR